MKEFLTKISIIVILWQIVIIKTEEVPSFRIIAPQNLCKKLENETIAPIPEGVTITFQPKDGIKLSYKFQIFFKIIGPDPLSQRETLLVWKAVRALEQRLNSADRLQIMKNNMALIKKTQVLPGISYIFHVVGVTDAGESSREQIFSIEYADGVLQNANVPEGINFLMLGSEEIVANIEFSVVAKVTFCKPKNDYYIEWRINELEEQYRDIENTIASELIVPRNSLNSDQKTAIEAQVKEFGTNRLLAKDVLMVEVLQKGFQAMIIPCAARIGEGTTLTFKVFLRNFDRVHQLEIKWLVLDAVSEEYLAGKEDNENSFKTQFEKSGTYEVVANVKINDILTKVKADIEVISSVFISYDFQEIPNLNPSSDEEFKFSVMVMNLVANCEASWLSAQEEGFKFIASGVLDKEHYGYTKISNLEKYYLEEIIDFTNSTVNREISLTIPTKYIKTDIMWPGFEGDAMYKFRLDVTCPKPFAENQQPAAEEEAWNKVVTSYFIIDLNTNSPPQALNVLIEPLQGLALKTIFNLNALQAKDLLLDSPLSYELKIAMDTFELSFGKYFEYKTWDIILPYTHKPMEILVNICDVRLACSTVKNETKLSINYEDLNTKEYQVYENKVIGLFQRTDFQEGFNYLIMATITFKNSKSPNYETFQKFVQDLLNKEIEKLIEQAENKIFINSDSKLMFVVNTKKILDYTQQMNKQLLEKLLEILENLMDFSDIKDSATLKQERFKRNSRNKRIINNSQELYTKTQLTLLEDILKSEEYSAQALQIFIDKISNLAQKICLNDHLNQESLKSSLVTLTLKKLQGDYVRQQMTQINENIFDKLVLQFKTVDKQLINPQAKYCLVIKSYNFKENLQDDISLIQYNIYEVLNSSHVREIQLGNINKLSTNVQLDIYPMEQHINKCLMKSSYTSQWSTDACKSLQMGKFLRCSCSQTGFLKTALVNIPIVSNEMSTTTISSLPTFNTLSSDNASATMITVTDKPHITTTVITKTVSTSLAATPTTSSNIQMKPLATMDTIRKASPVTYVIPLILVLILLILGILYVLHRRRSIQSLKTATSLPPSTVLEFRKPASGIKYANIHDDQLLSGNF